MIVKKKQINPTHSVSSAGLFRFCFQPGHVKPPTSGNTQLLHKIDYMAPANQSGISDVIDSLTNSAATLSCTI